VRLGSGYGQPVHLSRLTHPQQSTATRGLCKLECPGFTEPCSHVWVLMFPRSAQPHQLWPGVPSITSNRITHMHVYTYMNAHMHVCIHSHACRYPYMHSHLCAHIHACTHPFMHTATCVHIYMHTITYVQTHICSHKCNAQTCMQSPVYICTHMHIHTCTNKSMCNDTLYQSHAPEAGFQLWSPANHDQISESAPISSPAVQPSKLLCSQC
jgi:hypothetical protein